ncbi:Multidrug resistance transporter, Bcr/CflA family [Pseudoalteromonas luteoviolacea B = ATCC 29581]|nr:Multidrug resistance transporter, Bcr/CflA family [Pseudoalteromonas luteoviolacea B = ATCC 29581]
MNTLPRPSLATWLVLIFLVIFCPLAIDLYLPAFVEMADSLQVSEGKIQQTVSIFMLCVGLGQLLAGPLADKFGRKPVALVGIGLYACGGLLALAAQTWLVLMLARVIQGFGACATFVTCFAIVRDKFDGKKSGAMITYLNGIVCFIPALAPILGAYLTQQFDWRANFAFLLVFAAVGFLIIVLLFQESKPQDSVYEGHLLDLRRFKPFLQHRQFMFNAGITMIGMSGILVFVTAVPGWIMVHLGKDMHEFTFWFTANAVISIVASFIAPKWIKHHSRHALIFGLTLFIVAALALLVTRHIASPAAIMFPIFIASIGFALSLGAAAGNALASFPKQAGTASALIGVMQMSGAGLLAFLSQPWFSLAPDRIAFHLLALAPFLLVLLSQKRQLYHPI